MTNINEQESIDYYNSLPKKSVGGGVLIFNRVGDLLLVKPNYRDTWAWPGGGSDPGESPHATAVRECREEIGTCPAPLKPAFVNFVPRRANGALEVMHFVFTADPVDDNFMDRVQIPDDEIEAVQFVPVTDLDNYMKEYRVTAVQTYLQHQVAGAMLYLEDGILLGV